MYMERHGVGPDNNAPLWAVCSWYTVMLTKLTFCKEQYLKCLYMLVSFDENLKLSSVEKIW